MLNLTVHIVTTGFYRFISLLLTDYIKLLSLSLSLSVFFAVACFCLCHYEQDFAFGDRTALNFADLFIHWKLLFSLAQQQETKKTRILRWESSCLGLVREKRSKLAVFSDGKLVSLEVLFSVRHVSAARLVIFLSSVLLFCQVLLLAQKTQLAGVTYRWHDQLEIRKFWFAGIEWVICVHILHAYVRACYTFCRRVTRLEVLYWRTDTQCADGTRAPVDISVFWSRPVPVKLLCHCWCQSFLQAVKILPLTFIENGNSEAIKYKTVSMKSNPSQLPNPETVTSKFRLDLHRSFICSNRQQPQDAILGSRVRYWVMLPSESDVLLRLQTNV